MAFCSNCGNQMTGNTKFCPQCGADTSRPSGTTASAPMPAAVAPPPMPPIQPMAAAPPAYTPAGAIPVPIPVPAPAQPAQKKGMIGTVIVVVAVLAIGYYYYKTHYPTPTPGSNPPASQPAAGTPNNPPPSGNGGGGGNAALVNQQVFNAHWQDQSGMLNLTTATWQNNSTTNITSATLQCRQYNAAGTDLSEYRVTLNGPTNAGATSTFSNVSLGATATGMTKVDCAIIHVKP